VGNSNIPGLFFSSAKIPAQNKITLLVFRKGDTYICYNVSLHFYLIFIISDHDDCTSGSFGGWAAHYCYISNQWKLETCWNSEGTQKTFRWWNAFKDPGVWVE